MLTHPCFHKAAAHWFDTVHLPIAQQCNMKCNYCDRLSDCVHENKPGRASKILSVRQAYMKVARAVKDNPRLKVVGISGPGEALANKNTFKVLNWLNNDFPYLTKCVSTNGLMLADSLPELIAAGVSAVSVTVNGTDPQIVADMIQWITYQDKNYQGESAAELLISKQFQGIKAAAAAGIIVRINSILVPGINDLHLWQVALEARKAGALMMNIVPLVPQAGFIFYNPPTKDELALARATIARLIPVSPPCNNCAMTTAEMEYNSVL